MLRDTAQSLRRISNPSRLTLVSSGIEAPWWMSDTSLDQLQSNLARAGLEGQYAQILPAREYGRRRPVWSEHCGFPPARQMKQREQKKASDRHSVFVQVWEPRSRSSDLSAAVTRASIQNGGIFFAYGLRLHSCPRGWSSFWGAL